MFGYQIATDYPTKRKARWQLQKINTELRLASQKAHTHFTERTLQATVKTNGCKTLNHYIATGDDMPIRDQETVEIFYKINAQSPRTLKSRLAEIT